MFGAPTAATTVSPAIASWPFIFQASTAYLFGVSLLLYNNIMFSVKRSSFGVKFHSFKDGFWKDVRDELQSLP